MKNPNAHPRRVHNRAAIWSEVIASAALGAGFGVLIGTTLPQTPIGQQKYEDEYTAEGKCLHDTSFDLSLGAVVISRQIQPGGDTVLTIVPALPAIDAENLHFSDTRSPTGEEILTFADHQTAAVLASHGCPLPQGT